MAALKSQQLKIRVKKEMEFPIQVAALIFTSVCSKLSKHIYSNNPYPKLNFGKEFQLPDPWLQFKLPMNIPGDSHRTPDRLDIALCMENFLCQIT